MTLKPDEWMPLHVRKYLGDTMHLTRDQHGAYMLLLMAYWMRGGPLVDNDRELAAIAKASKPEWTKLRKAMAPFFEVTDGKWIQKRAETELATARSIVNAKSEAGKAGAAARWQKHPPAIGKDMADASIRHWQTAAPLPVPKPTSEEETKKDTSLRSAVVRTVIPDWIPLEAWNGFLEMRNKIKASVTEHGKLLLIAKLKKMRHSEDIGAVLDQSTMNSWKGVFPVKHDQNNGQRRPASAHNNATLGAALAIASLGNDADGGGEAAFDSDVDRPKLALLAS